MTTTDADTYNRTAKILVDSGRVGDIADATRYLEGLVLQLQVGPRINESLPAQAALLTAVNAGHRALLGGVRTTVEDDPVLSLPWARKMRLSDAIREFGGEVADALAPDAPILTIGKPRRDIRGRVNLNAVWRGWCGGVTEAPPADEHDHAIPLAGVLAGALGVSEIFQHLLGSATAARRDVGLSLWRPDLSWQAADAEGPELVSGPDGIWLLGLGHLGQANAWSLGCLPYQYPETADVMVVDVDDIVKANHATGLLTRHQDIGRHKTRVVASRLEALGHRCHIRRTPIRQQHDSTRPGAPTSACRIPRPRIPPSARWQQVRPGSGRRARRRTEVLPQHARTRVPLATGPTERVQPARHQQTRRRATGRSLRGRGSA